MATVSFDTAIASGPSEEEQGCKEFVRDVLNCAPVIEGVYPQILEDCDRFGMSERDLWQRMALYQKKGVISERGQCPLELGDGPGEKLRKRILTLIGKLPYESLEEFRGLVIFTASFLKRVEFVCDLVVYLFAEREKGIIDNEETETRVYTDFFVQKLLWELEKIREIGEQTSLGELEGEYVGWLADRIMDGEVLA
jgi:hypothetical protein